MRAVYRDSQGRTYSNYVEKHGNGWVMISADGTVLPITQTLIADNVPEPLTFDCYREDTPTETLRVEAMPGESNWDAARRAYAEREIAKQRKERQHARQEIQAAHSDRIEKLTQAARTQAAEIAHARPSERSRRGPNHQIKGIRENMSSYNAFVATHRFRGRPAAADPATAGSPKVPSRGGKSRGEIEAMAQQHGWTPRELTRNDVESMSSEELLFHEMFNSAALQKVFEIEANKKAHKENMEAWRIKRMWEDGGEEIEAALPEVSKFVAAHPQFIGSNAENRQAIVNWLVQMNVRCTYANLVRAFQDLAKDGKLILLDGDTELCGDALKNSPRLRVLLEPQSRPLPAEESADAFYAAHPELHPGKPYLIKVREERDANTQAHFAKAAASTSKASVVSTTVYPDEQSGYLQFSKYKFKKYVAELSAAEYQEKLNDPSFVAALDRTADGNK